MNYHLINVLLSSGSETLNTAAVCAEYLLARTIAEIGGFGR
jgi:hypothetical protein